MDTSKTTEQARKEAMQVLGMADSMLSVSMLTLVMQGNPIREFVRTGSCSALTAEFPQFRDTALVALLINIADRFEALIREGKTTSQALKQMRAEGLLDRYQQMTEPKPEMH